MVTKTLPTATQMPVPELYTSSGCPMLSAIPQEAMDQRLTAIQGGDDYALRDAPEGLILVPAPTAFIMAWIINPIMVLTFGGIMLWLWLSHASSHVFGMLRPLGAAGLGLAILVGLLGPLLIYRHQRRPPVRVCFDLSGRVLQCDSPLLPTFPLEQLLAVQMCCRPFWCEGRVAFSYQLILIRRLPEGTMERFCVKSFESCRRLRRWAVRIAQTVGCACLDSATKEHRRHVKRLFSANQF